MNPPKDQYPNALEVIRQITNLTRGEDCIYRGESSINFGYPCSSTLYRQLRKENATPGSIRGLLKKRQYERIKASRKYKDMGDNDLERLMSFRHFGDKLNLLDFTETHLVALFFVCFEQDKLDEDGLIVVKQKSDFRILETEEGTLPDRETVLLEPHEDLKRARDQHGVFLHVPEGKIELKPGEAVLIKGKNKREILNFLEKEHISEATMFRDAYSEIERRNREDEERVAMNTQSTTESTTKLQGFAKPKDNRNILVMEYYARLSGTHAEGRIKELLDEHANTLITSFTEILKYNPQDAEAYFNRAFVHQSKSEPDYNRAISDYTHAIELKPNYVEAYVNRGLAHTHKPYPDYDQAILDYKHATELDPSDALAYYDSGIAQMNKPNPDYAQALSDFGRAIEFDPDDIDARYDRGLVYLRKSPPDYDRAILDFTRVLKLNPKHPRAYINRGNAYISKSPPDYDRAILDFSSSIESQPGYAEAYYNRGNVHATKPDPDYDRAISDYTRAIVSNPNLGLAYYHRGVVYAIKPSPDYKMALADLNKFLEQAPESAETYLLRAEVYAAIGDCVKAQSDHNTALKIAPKLAKATLSPTLKKCIEARSNGN